jgi:hypothetical protein
MQYTISQQCSHYVCRPRDLSGHFTHTVYFLDILRSAGLLLLTLLSQLYPKSLCLRWNCPAPPALPALAHRLRRSHPSQTLSIRCLLSPCPLFPCMRMHIGDKEQGTRGRAGARCEAARCALPTGSPPTSLIVSPILPPDWDDDAISTRGRGQGRAPRMAVDGGNDQGGATVAVDDSGGQKGR